MTQKWKIEEKVRGLVWEAQYVLENEGERVREKEGTREGVREKERERNRLYQSESQQQTQFTSHGSDKENFYKVTLMKV